MGEGKDVIAKLLTVKGIIGFCIFLVFESASNLVIGYLKALSGIDNMTDVIDLGLFKFPKQLIFGIGLTILGMVLYNALPLSKMVKKFIDANRDKL